MGGGVIGRPASLAGFTSVLVLLSAAFVASTPVSTLPSGGYNGMYEQVRHRLLSLLRILRLNSVQISISNTRTQSTLAILQMYVTGSSTTLSTFPDFPRLTPSFTFTLPNLNYTAQPGLWSNSVSTAAV